MMGTFSFNDDELGRTAADVAKVGTPVSISFVSLLRDEYEDGTVLHRGAHLNELSLVHKGAFPGAKIIRIREQPTTRTAARAASSLPDRHGLKPGDVVIHTPPGQLVRRYFPAKFTIR